MREFWVDPEAPRDASSFADRSREFTLLCNLGWCSGTAAKPLQEMGMTNVAHMDCE